MPVCSEMPWGGGPFHGPCGPFGFGARGGFGACGRGGFGGAGRGVFAGCSRGGFGWMGRGGFGPMGWGGFGPVGRGGSGGHHGGRHRGHCGGDGSFGWGFGPRHGQGGPAGGHGAFRGGCGPCGSGGPVRGACSRGGWGRGRGHWGHGARGACRWGAAGAGQRRWHCRPGAFDSPFEDAPLVGIFLNFDFPVYSQDGETGEEVPTARAEPTADEGAGEPGVDDDSVIKIDTRQFAPEDIRVSYRGSQLEVTASRADDAGEVTLRRSIRLRPGSRVTARLGADGYLYIRAEQPAEERVDVEVDEAQE